MTRGLIKLTKCRMQVERVTVSNISEELVVVPSEDDLEIESEGNACHVEGCERIFKTSSQLHMHLTKHHRGEPLAHRIRNTVYYCPVKGCGRNRTGRGKPFPRLGQLKQHYQRLHGEKAHTCAGCGKEFALRDAYSRHTSNECGKKITCKTCGETFLTKNALYKHARRKEHELPEGSKARARIPRVPSLSSCVHSPCLPVQVIVKQVIKLSSPVSSSTQTEPSAAQESEAEGDGKTVRRKQLQMVRSTHNMSNGSDCIVSPLLSPLIYLDLSTQTDIASSSRVQGLPSSFNLNDLATQTDIFEFCTRSASSQTYLVSDMQQQAEGSPYLQTPSDQQDMRSILPPSAVDIYSPPQGPLQGLECVGTQTMNEHRYADEALGMATQTSPNNFYCPLTDEDSRIDFGTQTVDWLTDVASLLPASCYEMEQSTGSSRLQDQLPD